MSYGKEYPIALPRHGFNSMCAVAFPVRGKHGRARGIPPLCMTYGNWKILIIYSLDAVLLNSSWDHQPAMVLGLVVELRGPSWNVFKMNWPGCMMVKNYITTVDARTLGKVLLQFVAVEPPWMGLVVSICLKQKRCFDARLVRQKYQSRR